MCRSCIHLETHAVFEQGVTEETSYTFYTSTTLVDTPADNLYYDTITQLLLTVPGVGSVTTNPLDNIITIETTRGNDTLQGQEISVDLIIEYDIMCLT